MTEKSISRQSNCEKSIATEYLCRAHVLVVYTTRPSHVHAKSAVVVLPSLVVCTWPGLLRVHVLLCYKRKHIPIARACLSCAPGSVMCDRAFCRGQLCHDKAFCRGQLCRDINSHCLGQLCRDIKILSRDRKST